ncbi:MAG TPA: hypothetical protein VEG61_03900 [Candidatus Dormibacteraeota bacterium]|nr:hypothetical protein [Candidatus Dormibacteraeota bacterium]
MDSDVLIKITKASIKSVVVSNFDISIPLEVRSETVDEGKSRGYPDAIKIEENIATNKLKVTTSRSKPNVEKIIGSLNLLGGEAASLRLFMRGGYAAIASDDQRFISLLDGLGIAYMTPASLLVHLMRQERISLAETKKYLEEIRPFISDEEYLTSLQAIRGES